MRADGELSEISHSPRGDAVRLETLHEDAQLVVLLARQASHTQTETGALLFEQLETQVQKSVTRRQLL